MSCIAYLKIEVIQMNIMDRLAEYRQLIATTKYDIKLMKTDEFNRYGNTITIVMIIL